MVKEEDWPPETNFDVAKMATQPSPERVQIETEKKISLIKAWEESQKCKAANKAEQKKSSIVSWENSKQAHLEAEIRKYEESLEMKKARHLEKMKNKIAMVHKSAEEKRAIAEARRGEDIIKAEEEAARYRATGEIPKKSSWFNP